MRSLLQFVLFQSLWFAAVRGAAHGWAWLGVLCLAPYLLVQLVWTSGRRRAFLRWTLVGALGSLLDCGLGAVDLVRYPVAPEGWPTALVPPFILVLWIAFATLPEVSLAWLAGRPALAALLGALGGPLSFLAGVRLGAVTSGPSPVLTYAALALEYAFATPLLVRNQRLAIR